LKVERGVFLDRDGVINDVVFRNGKPASPRSLEEWVWAKGVGLAVNRLKYAAFKVFVITNQPDVAREKIDPSVLKQMMDEILIKVSVDDIRVCPHDNQDGCSCRKPQPGMLHYIAEKWKINLNRSYIIGDSWKDMEAGRRSGCKTILIGKEYNKGAIADYVVSDIVIAADRIITSQNLVPSNHPVVAGE
jgi:D-glycero-D-manno-heptose 1,7-bisphosphate phosphatase